ncbi:PKD domain-containing protein [Cellulomonas fimi]|uniref:PKD domain containing protein n=1 Tax=Cellulomonas fimi (strain ATCC 484 / DSM 20113 / JCM 1341 / CCUG 24087 / LMG 16345 / NBRC 15513 / NCIMB 8980 / NCTC 7547 / NRS-133) TaxID=590998 RepID=F4H229_CELFA|nr:PKD domain-containing protein [Cellulomonas fimi]AEE45199.1 PKD domain containing protein [Cellulomonas fimi ATCC 484]NNH07135.1 PKD domain-containing protein [Cellulomonas fimi]VEH28543.1 Protease 1 precursor [Cellulomonas fimi]
MPVPASARHERPEHPRRLAHARAVVPGPRRHGRRLAGTLALVGAVLAGGLVAAPAGAADPEPFTFVVLPDTQNYVSTSTNQATMGVQTQWIADHRDDLDIAFVSQVGDLVGVDTAEVQWQRASQHMAVLDAAGVPNAVLPGNHDMDLTTGDAPLFRQYFPPSRYANASWNGAAASYGGHLGQHVVGPDPVDRQNMDSFALFSAGGMDFLLLSLEMNAPDYALDWGRRVLAAYPERRAIVATHSYVDTAGGLTTQVARADGGNSGRAIWEELVRPSCSVFLVVSGHFSEGDLGEARRTDTNACGDPVHAVLTDYQDRARGGDGWLRYYTFDPAADEIRATTYSPTLDRYETDADSSFTLPYAMTGVPPDPDPGPLAADTFGRTLTGGWGGADTGGAWSVGGGSSRFAVGGGTGQQSPAPGGTVTSTLGSVQSTATDVTASVALDRIPSNALYATVSGRVVGSGDYGARLKVLATGAVQLHTERSGTVLTGGTLPGVSLTSGERLRVRVQVEGTGPTVVRVRAWEDGQPEPSTWQHTATDATPALQGAGGVRLMTYVSSTTTGGALTVRWDDLLATRIGAAPPPPPPVNQPPVASFTVATDGLTVAVDASGSSDPDGIVVARSWAFGDGATASGTTAARTYAAAGTYTVTLTVTDDDGAVASTARAVTVSAPPPVGVLAADPFDRTVTGGWGAAATGGPWTVAGGASRFSVAAGAGAMQVPAGATLTAGLGAVSGTSTDLTASLALASVPDGPLYATLSGRVVGGADLGARVKVLTTGAVQLHTERTGTVLTGGTLPGVVLTPGARLRVRVQVQGTAPTTVRARAWLEGSPEPSTWQYAATDGTAALQAAGSVRLMSYLSSSATTGPVTVRWDDVLVTPAG